MTEKETKNYPSCPSQELDSGIVRRNGDNADRQYNCMKKI
jgi:hypothetical protein